MYNITDTFGIGKMMAFMEKLSPEMQLEFAQFSMPKPPDFSVPPPSSPPEQTSFFNAAAGLPSEQEALVLSTLLIIHFEKPRTDGLTLEKWLLDVESDSSRMAALGSKWHPVGRGVWHPKKHILSELEAALRTTVMVDGGDGTVETAAAIASAWFKTASYVFIFTARDIRGEVAPRSLSSMLSSDASRFITISETFVPAGLSFLR